MRPRTRSFLTPIAVGALGLAAGLTSLACGDDSQTPRTGAELWVLQGCITCHGKDAQGTPIAPSLHGVQTHWTRESLLEYLRNPPLYIQKDARLKEQKKGYSQNMPVYGMLPPAHLEALADHVLALK